MMSKIRGSQLLEIFKNKADNPTVGNWMFNFCNRKGGTRHPQQFLENLDYGYKIISDPINETKDEKLVYLFTVECEHGWHIRKQFPEFILKLSKVPDNLIGTELEHSARSIQVQCKPCSEIV